MSKEGEPSQGEDDPGILRSPGFRQGDQRDQEPPEEVAFPHLTLEQVFPGQKAAVFCADRNQLTGLGVDVFEGLGKLTVVLPVSSIDGYNALSMEQKRHFLVELYEWITWMRRQGEPSIEKLVKDKKSPT